MPADVAPANAGQPPVLAQLRATCRRQSLLIDRLCETISVLRSGACALKAENAALRSEAAALRGASTGSADAEPAEPLVQASLHLDVHAPAAARELIAGSALQVHLGPRRLEMAQLVVSQLVTERLFDGVPSADDSIVVRARLEGGRCRLEVDAPRRAGAVPVHDPGGLDLLPELCDAWGSEHASGGATRSWAHVARAPQRAREPSPERRLRLVQERG